MLGGHVLSVCHELPSLRYVVSLKSCAVRSYVCERIKKIFVLCFYKYKLLLQYGDLEKYIHIISDNKHIIQTKIKNKTKQNKHQFYYLPVTHFWYMTLKH